MRTRGVSAAGIDERERPSFRPLQFSCHSWCGYWSDRIVASWGSVICPIYMLIRVFICRSCERVWVRVIGSRIVCLSVCELQSFVVKHDFEGQLLKTGWIRETLKFQPESWEICKKSGNIAFKMVFGVVVEQRLLYSAICAIFMLIRVFLLQIMWGSLPAALCFTGRFIWTWRGTPCMLEQCKYKIK